MRTFAELLSEYIERAGISDSELARSIGVRRQTLFRWKDGQIQRPRYRDDVLRCARRLRLTPEERNLLLTAAGFSPEAPPLSVREQPSEPVRETPSADDSAEEESQDAVPQSSVTSSRRPWVIGFAGGLVIVVGIALATAMLSNSDGETPVAKVVSTSTPTPQPTSPVPTPTAVIETPIPVVVTPEPETEEDVVVIARFVNYIGGETGFNVAGRIRAALEEYLEEGFIPRIKIKVLSEDVRDEAEALDAAKRTNASIVIWGEYDSGRAQARFTVPALDGSMEESQVERPVVNASDLTATINTELPHDVRLLALLILARLYESGEDSKEARDLLDEALTTLPKEPDTVATIYFQLGYLYQVREPPNLPAAGKYYTLAILYNPDSPTPYYNRSLTYYEMGELFYKDALADMLWVHDHDPYDPEKNRSLCWLMTVTHKPESAIPYCDAAVEGGVERAYFSRGTAYLQLEGPEAMSKAIADFNESLLKDPDDVDSYLNRGLAYFKLGEAHNDQALDDFHHILTIDSDHTEALNNLCWCMSLVGRAAEGLLYCESALSIKPDNYLAYDSRALAHALLGNYEKAMEDFNRFLDWLDTQPSHTYNTYGPRRERWVESLSKGENPFDEAELLALRKE